MVCFVWASICGLYSIILALWVAPGKALVGWSRPETARPLSGSRVIAYKPRMPWPMVFL